MAKKNVNEQKEIRGIDMNTGEDCIIVNIYSDVQDVAVYDIKVPSVYGDNICTCYGMEDVIELCPGKTIKDLPIYNRIYRDVLSEIIDKFDSEIQYPDLTKDTVLDFLEKLQKQNK